ncbi:hypothetical protein ColLi_12669 [Colletotrichum liriopes]|uniref:Uncharacterized protein n=1 Tax=Colletotrichum liriopes TaxID=708192 RepID=A0AA37LZR6_9PEZI|nr:hypothetical protein ColLi_12669 [Colletotrichum liriopes]
MNFPSEPEMNAAHMRPVSPRMPLEIAARLPYLRKLDCPWLWERFPSHPRRSAYLPTSGKALGVMPAPSSGGGCAMSFPRCHPPSPKVRHWFWKPKPCEDYVDQATQMHDLVGASSSTCEFEDMDSVSPGLWVLGSRLEELDICMLITTDLFHSGETFYYRR